MADLVLTDVSGNKLERLEIASETDERQPFYESLSELGKSCSEDALLLLELARGEHLLPLGSAIINLSESRLPTFTDYLIYIASWYERDALAGKHILPWHRDYFNADTDEANAAIYGLCQRVLYTSIDGHLSPEDARALLEMEEERLAAEHEIVRDSVVRDLIHRWLGEHDWVGIPG